MRVNLVPVAEDAYLQVAKAPRPRGGRLEDEEQRVNTLFPSAVLEQWDAVTRERVGDFFGGK
jgi:hypothetical protein